MPEVFDNFSNRLQRVNLARPVLQDTQLCVDIQILLNQKGEKSVEILWGEF